MRYSELIESAQELEEARGSDDIFQEALWWFERWVSGSITDPDWDYGKPCSLDVSRAMEVIAERIGNQNSVGKTLYRYIIVPEKEARQIYRTKLLQPHEWTFQSFTEHADKAQAIGEEINLPMQGQVAVIVGVKPPPNLVMFGMSDIKRAKRRDGVSGTFMRLADWHHQGEVIVRMTQPLPVETVKPIRYK